MLSDPYSPPARVDGPSPDRRSALSFAAFIVSAMLTALLVLLTMAYAYQNDTFIAGFDNTWQRLPTHVLRLPLLSMLCTVTMALAAMSFRQNRSRRALSWFGLTAVVFLGVPPLLQSMFS